jgi:hypothetical protein
MRRQNDAEGHRPSGNMGPIGTGGGIKYSEDPILLAAPTPGRVPLAIGGLIAAFGLMVRAWRGGGKHHQTAPSGPKSGPKGWRFR